MKLNKIVAPILVSAMLTQAVPALAVSQHPFTDVPTWASEAVAYSYEKGYVNGTTSTTYNSKGEISIVEFIKVMVQMCTTEDQRTTILEEAGATPEQIATDWTYQYRVIGEKIGLYDGLEQYAADKGETKCTRANMAKLLVNALKARGEDVTKANVTKAVAVMSDTLAIQSSGASQEIGTAIAFGLIAGDNNKAFNPSGTMDRASACEIFQRLDNPSGQREAVIKQVGLDGSNTSVNGGGGGNQTVSGSITIDMRDTSTSHREPREGDTIIRPDGSSVILARDPVTGVLGYGQNVGAYLGTATQSGKPVAENGFTSATTQGWSDQLAGGSYMKSTVLGQESTYHWTNEWDAIREKTFPGSTKGTDGETAAGGLWVYSAKASAGAGNWLWQGPSA